MPTQTVVIRQKAGKVKATKGVGFWGFIWRHKFTFLTLFFMIPLILTVAKQTIEEKNPLVPILVLGTAVLDADQLIYDDVNTLREDPNSLFFLNDDTTSLIGKIKFFFNRLWLFWKLTSNFWFIIINLKLYYWLWKVSPFSTTSHAFNNFTLGLITMVLVMLFTNFVILVIDLQENDVIFGEDLNNTFTNNSVVYLGDGTFFTKALNTIKYIYPFRGIINFIQFTPELLNIIKIPIETKGRFEGIINKNINSTIVNQSI